MKIFDLHHRCHNGCHEKRLHNWSRGSIMIWTVMLGLLLTSVFFFFSMRQRMMVAVQRDTAAQQSAKMLMESYADYLQAHPTEIKYFTGGKYYGITTINGIFAKLTRYVDFIENSIDEGQTQTYHFVDPDHSGPFSIYIEWNRSSEGKGDLLVNDVLYKSKDYLVDPGNDYANLIGPISVSDPFTVKTLNTPFSFKIRGAVGTQAIDNLWHMELTKDLDYGKTISIKRTFQ